MNRLLASVGLGLLLTVGGSTTGAQAHHDQIPGPPVVEGGASVRLLQQNADGTLQYAHSCKAVTRGGLVASTGATCRVVQNEVVLDEVGIAGEANWANSPPRLVNVADAPFQICWEARAMTLHNQWVYDVVEPNCADF